MEGHFELDGHRTWYRTIGDRFGAVVEDFLRRKETAPAAR